MTDEDFQEYNSAKKMTEMMQTNDNIFKNNTKAISLKNTLIADIEQLDAIGAASVSGRGRQTDGTVDKKAGEAALDTFLRKIAADAKIIKKAEPDFDNQFKIPRTGYNTAKMLDVARSFINDLTAPIVAKFGEYGATSVTPENIQTKINQIEAGSIQQNAGRGASIAATGAIRAIMVTLKANRRILKGIGENILEENGDAGLIAEWKSTCRLERRKKRTEPEE